jgi:phage baseplate assembly protein W
MPTVLPDIKSTNWQISTAGFGIIAEGLEDIRQSIDLILRTSRGSDNLRPQFGSDIYQYVDSPVNVCIPNVKRSILEAVSIWEKRVKIVRISHKLEGDGSNIIFNITYQLIDQDLIDSITLYLSGGFTTSTPAQGLILQAFYPPNPYGKPYIIELLTDGSQVLPTPPTSGFNTINGMFAWVKTNWSYLGRWVQLIDRFVLYMNPGLCSTASIAISLLTGTIRVEALLPLLTSGQHYVISFLPDAIAPVPAFTPTTINTKDQLLLWVQTNWGSYGTWELLPGNVDMYGDFSAMDFSSDFFIGSQGYFLVLTSTTVTAATLTVTAA